uniref:Uncharacterized protein n=1 Tax=Oncorhynchus tshawytscha TaxID=74940 RepID=A0AAZ3NV91_ONCTS
KTLSLPLVKRCLRKRRRTKQPRRTRVRETAETRKKSGSTEDCTKDCTRIAPRICTLLNDDERADEEEAKLSAAVSAPIPATESEEAATTGNGVEAQEKEPGDDDDSDSDSDDDDDDVRVTIGDIKTGAPQYTTYGVAPVNLNIKTAGARPYGTVGNKLKGVDLEAPGNINGVPVVEVDMETFEEKPWRKP